MTALGLSGFIPQQVSSIFLVTPAYQTPHLKYINGNKIIQPSDGYSDTGNQNSQVVER
jgi:hypothetical protein